jgi:TolA protein
MPFWGVGLSMGAHVAAVATALLVARSAPAKVVSVPTGDAGLQLVELDGSGEAAAASEPRAPTSTAHKATAARAPRDDDGDDGFLPRRTKKRTKRERADDRAAIAAAKADEAAKSKAEADAAKEAERAAMREAVRKTMLSPGGGDAPAGNGNPGAGQGSGGSGKKAGVSSRYAGMLDGWFSSRVSLRGLNMPWDELKTLSVVVTIQLTPDRHVSGFSVVKPSGNGAYDARVSGSLSGVVSSGATMPAPPDDEEVPPQITLRFRCRSQERCS